MKPFLSIVALAWIGFCPSARGAGPQVTLSSRVTDDSMKSLLMDVREPAAQMIDEVRLELPRNSAETAVLSLAPKDWKLERDGHSIRLSGPAARVPLRLRVTLFDLGVLDRVRTRIRLQGKDMLDAQLMTVELPRLNHASSTADFLELPPVIHPGEALEMKVLNPAQTPLDGQWIIAGVPATVKMPDHVRVQLPNDLPAGAPLRVSFFDVWGERIVDALSVEDTTLNGSTFSGPTAPKITGCARYAFIGQSVCVCGDFPEWTWNSIRLDGQPATIISASAYALKVALPDSLTPGVHEITGDPTAGFSPQDKTSVLALRLAGSIDANALLRGQSTTLRLAVAGTSEPMTLVVLNLSPGVVSIPGGNYQNIKTSGGANNSAERRVDATGRGNFQITYSLEGARCPCEEDQKEERLSTASSTVPIFVPRRVLATIAIGTPAAMYATAQAVATANGLSLVEVFPLASTNEGLAVFEIIDGVGAVAKAVALAADPRVTLAQPDVVYDTSQEAPSSAELIYGRRLIGADLVQNLSRGDGVRLGVVDTGIDNGNPDLRQRLAEYSDVTGTGWTPDAHGSLVAGIIAADSTSGPGLAGVAPGAKLVGVKSCVAQSSRSAAARCWSSTLARGIDVATQKNVRIINLSVGGPDDKLMARVVDAAMTKGIAVVSAAGNDGPSGKPSYPAAFKGVIAVTAVDAAAHIYSRATQGTYVTLSAPGVDILSTGPGGRTQAFTGTSAATAFVSGAVALLLQQRPNLSLSDLRTLLLQTARRLGPTAPDPEFGYGLLDVCQAMAKLANRQSACR
jgi:Subtilase family